MFYPRLPRLSTNVIDVYLAPQKPFEAFAMPLTLFGKAEHSLKDPEGNKTGK